MDIKDLENKLREYKKNKSTVETTLERIKAYEFAIDNPDLWSEVMPASKEIGIISPKGYNSTSPVEHSCIDKEKGIETLKKLIKDDESRIFMKRLEVNQIEIALNSLTLYERYIIERKYFDKMFWKDIERVFNDKHRQNNYITVEGLRIMNKAALVKLLEILEPFYSQFRIA